MRCVVAAGVVGLGLLAAMPVRAAGLPLSTPTPGILGLSTPTPGPTPKLGSTPSLCGPVVTGATAPDATGAPQHYGRQGTTVTVSGANFAQPGCSLKGVHVGSAAISSGITVTSNSSLTFKLPPNASGPVSVTEVDALGNTGSSNANHVFIETPSGSVASATPVEKSSEAVVGSGYQPFLPAKSGGLPGSGVKASYTGCDGGDESVVASAVDSGTLELPGPGSYCDGTVVLTFYAPEDTSRSKDCNPQSTTPNCIAVVVDAASVDVYFFIASVSPAPFSDVKPGQLITFRGSGFGASGRADLAGLPAKVQWNDHSIAVTVPSGAATGELRVQRGTGDLQAFQIGSYLIPGAPGGGGGGDGNGSGSGTGTGSGSGTGTGSGSGSGTGSGVPGSSGDGVPGGPVIGPDGVPVYTSIAAGRAGGPHGSSLPGDRGDTPQSALSISVDRTTAPVGSVARITITFTLDGKPVSGAPVRLLLLASPASDASVFPNTGSTDIKGVFQAVLQLSHKPGDHLVLATSGIYSDEVHVQGQPVVAAAHGGSPKGLDLRLAGNPVMVWLAVATGALVLMGVLVNIDVLRRFLWSMTIGKLISRRKAARRAPAT